MSKLRYWLVFINPKTNKGVIYDKCKSFQWEFSPFIEERHITQKVLLRLPAETKDEVNKFFSYRVKKAIKKLERNRQ